MISRCMKTFPGNLEYEPTTRKTCNQVGPIANAEPQVNVVRELRVQHSREAAVKEECSQNVSIPEEGVLLRLLYEVSFRADRSHFAKIMLVT